MWKPSLWIWRNTFVPCSLHRCLASLTIWVKQPLTAAAFQLKSVLHKPKDDFLCSQYACFGNSRLLYGSNSFLFCGRLFLSRSSIFRSERTSPARTAVFVLPLYKYIERRQMHVCRRRRFARRFVVSRSLFPKKKSPDCVGCLDLLSVYRGFKRDQKRSGDSHCAQRKPSRFLSGYRTVSDAGQSFSAFRTQFFARLKHTFHSDSGIDKGRHTSVLAYSYIAAVTYGSTS